MVFGAIGSQPNRFLGAAEGAVPLTKLAISLGKAGLVIRLLWPSGDGPTDQRGSECWIPALERDHPEQIVGIRTVGIFGQRRLVSPGRPVEITLPMLFQGLGQVYRHKCYLIRSAEERPRRLGVIVHWGSVDCLVRMALCEHPALETP